MDAYSVFNHIMSSSDLPRFLTISVKSVRKCYLFTGFAEVVENIGKGHLISKCLFGVIVWTKKPTKYFPGFLP